MRKLILVSAIVLLSTSAFAGGSRGLSSSSAPLPAPQPQIVAPQPQLAAPVPQIVELQKPARRAEVTVLPAPGEEPAATTATTAAAAQRSIEDKLKAAGELKPDGTPAHPAQAAAPVQPAPVQRQTRAASVSTQATAPVAARPAVHAHKPVRQRVAHRREGTEHKARRIAARFGIYW